MEDLHQGSGLVRVYCRRGGAVRRGAGFAWLIGLLFQLLPALAPASSLPAGIVGGSDAAAGAWPWQVSVGATGLDPYNGHFCGGALINTGWVATAAHCVVDSSTGKPVKPGSLTITLGTNDLRSGGLQAGVTAIVINPKFDLASFDNDIALLELDRPATCSGCNPIPLVTSDVEPRVAPPGTQATVTGWGVTSPTGITYPALLQQAQVPIVDNGTCATDYGGNTITPQMICAGTGGTDSCQGDSGGPLVVPNNQGTGYLLAGLVSFGDGCANAAFPGVYTRMSSVSSWVGTTAVLSSGGGGGGEAASVLLMLCLFVLWRAAANGREFLYRKRSPAAPLSRADTCCTPTKRRP